MDREKFALISGQRSAIGLREVRTDTLEQSFPNYLRLSKSAQQTRVWSTAGAVSSTDAVG
jgi:hypothetical protein